MTTKVNCPECGELKEKIKRLRPALRNLYEACMTADAQEELSEHVDGSLLDAARLALKDA